MMNRKLMMAVMMAATMAEIFPAPRSSRRQELDDGPLYPAPTPPPQRNVAADAEAMEKAEAKRQRKAAKRRAEVGAGDTADKRPNVELTGAAPHGQQTKPQEIEK